MTSEFYGFILDVLMSIPEINLSLPTVVYDVIKELILLVDAFVDLNYLSSILMLSISYSFCCVSFAVFDYIRSFKK